MKKKITRQAATKKADLAMGQFIRLRDCLWTGKNPKWGHCISCYGICSYEYSETRDPRVVGQAGHYVPRRHKSLRWDLHNVNLQCRHCNEFLHGNLDSYREGLIAKYGQEAVERLEFQRLVIKKYTVEEILD